MLLFIYRNQLDQNIVFFKSTNFFCIDKTDYLIVFKG